MSCFFPSSSSKDEKFDFEEEEKKIHQSEHRKEQLITIFLIMYNLRLCITQLTKLTWVTRN